MPLVSSIDSKQQSRARTVSVSLCERSYDIVVESDVLQRIGEHVARAICGSAAGDGRRVLIVTDPTVQQLYEQAASQSLRNAGFLTETVCLPGGETHKTLAAVDRIYERLLACAADRRTIIVALGGGVVGDIAGFAAASYQRGLDFVQVPTTLLAQVDSSVGGKTGVNYGPAKNLIGAFHQPRLVLIDCNTLATLSVGERRSGMAEVIKYGAIADVSLFQLLQRDIGGMLGLKSDVLTYAVARSCEIKARIVEADERETTGARATLNFGHTIGHALEAATGYNRYRHGEAIAVGMITACLIGEAIGVTSTMCTQALVELLISAGFEAAPDASIPADSILTLLTHDKKSIDGAARFVLLDSIGAASSGHAVPIDVIRAALSRQQILKSG